MDQIEFLRPEGLLLSPAFSWVAVIPPGATTIHVGGIDATTADGTLVGEGDIGAQTEQVLTNLRIALEAAGTSMQDLVSWQLFVVDGVDLTEGYQAAAAHLPKDREPPLITVAIVPKLGCARCAAGALRRCGGRALSASVRTCVPVRTGAVEPLRQPLREALSLLAAIHK